MEGPSAQGSARGTLRPWLKAAGVVVVRQRPGPTKGFVFLSLVDETGNRESTPPSHDLKTRRRFRTRSTGADPAVPVRRSQDRIGDQWMSRPIRSRNRTP